MPCPSSFYKELVSSIAMVDFVLFLYRLGIVCKSWRAQFA